MSSCELSFLLLMAFRFLQGADAIAHAVIGSYIPVNHNVAAGRRKVLRLRCASTSR